MKDIQRNFSKRFWKKLKGKPQNRLFQKNSFRLNKNFSKITPGSTLVLTNVEENYWCG